MSSEPRLVHGTDFLSQAPEVTASATDSHGRYHDYVGRNDAEALSGLADEIEDADYDDDDDDD